MKPIEGANKAKRKVVGVLNIVSHMAGRFGADDVSPLNSIGDYLGTAIEEATLYERPEGQHGPLR